MNLNKSFITNALALTLIGLSFLFEKYHKEFLYTGLFALSGALTNQLAIHMLFEKIPFLYGSGVIPARFEAFKRAIKELIMEQFFTKERLDAFFAKEEQKIDLTPIIEKTDFSIAYEALAKTVMDSPFGGMLGMFGGERALEGLREPFTQKMKSAIIKIVNSKAFKSNLHEYLQSSTLGDDMLCSIEKIVQSRLDELSAQMVKEIVQKLIQEHLGWLVVWGGVFGGLIGLLGSFVL
jgi:uncharacterized membrane protein YheB (UPF0754 family)